MAALLVGERFLRLRQPGHQGVHRLDDDEEDRRRGRDERDRGRDERAVAEDGVVDREREIAEVRLADDHRDDRHHEIVDERGDERAEREPHHEGHRQLDEVAAHQEVPELLDHRSSSGRLGAPATAMLTRRAADYNHSGMLGEVLTAVVTPFRADGSVDLDAFRLVVRIPRRERLRRRRRDRHDGRGADAHGRRAPVAVRGRGRGDRRPGDGRRGDRHVLDGALDPPDGSCPRAWRRRLPRRDAVLQPASAARPSSPTSRRSPRRRTDRSSSTTSRRASSWTPSPRRSRGCPRSRM